MTWASPYIQKLQHEEMVEFRPHGNSMTPRVKSGQLCTVIPLTKLLRPLKAGDAVLCKVKGKHYLHLISAIKDKQYQISNNHGFVNGWITIHGIFGILVDAK